MSQFVNHRIGKLKEALRRRERLIVVRFVGWIVPEDHKWQPWESHLVRLPDGSVVTLIGGTPASRARQLEELRAEAEKRREIGLDREATPLTSSPSLDPASPALVPPEVSPEASHSPQDGAEGAGSE